MRRRMAASGAGGGFGGAPESVALHLSWIAKEFGRSDYLPFERRDLDALADVGEIVEFDTDARIYRQGDPATAAYLLRNGTVDLWRDGERPLVQLARISSGSMLGDVEMFTEGRYLATAMVVEPTVAIRLERDEVMATLAANPRLALRWLVAALAQLGHAHKRIGHLMRKSVKARLAGFLLAETENRDEVLLSHADLANLLGTNRATLSRAVADLRAQGAIETGRRVIRVADREVLRRTSDA